MICCYDTETSGMPLWGRDPLDPGQPHLLQLGCVVVGLDWKEIASMRLIVQPDGWSVPDEVTKIHGITHDTAVRYGIPIKPVLVTFLEMVKRSRYLVSYSSSFDKWFIDAELKRLGSDDPGVAIPGVRSIDIMKTGAVIMPNGRWGKLRVMHEILCGTDYPDAHDGLADARATLRCMRPLVERKIIEL